MRTIIDARNVDRLKLKRGIFSDRQLAVAAGLHRNTLNNVLRRGRPWSSVTLDQLAKVLRCNPLDLQVQVPDEEVEKKKEKHQ